MPTTKAEETEEEESGRILDYLDDVEIRNLDGELKNGRFYEIIENGTSEQFYFQSVTTIIGDVLAKGEGYERWLGGANSYDDAMEYANERADLGEKVHGHCEDLVRGAELFMEPWSIEEKKKTQGFGEYVEDHNPEFIATEFPIYSKKLGFAGRVDLLVRNPDGELVITDIKTSSRIYKSHKAQLFFYKYGLSELGIEVDKLQILKLRNQAYTLKTIDSDRSSKFFGDMDYKQVVEDMVEIYDWFGRPEPKWKEQLPKTISLEDYRSEDDG